MFQMWWILCLIFFLGSSVHSSISFSVKICFKIPNITFSCKVYLKSRVNLPCVGNDLNYILRVVYNSQNPVSDLNKVIISLFYRLVPFKVIRQKVNDKAWFNEYCVNAFHSKHNVYHL